MQQFVNTNDREAGRDSLANPQALAQWLTHWTDVVGRPPGLAAALRQLQLQLVLDGDAFGIASPTPLGRALAPVVEAARTARADGTWARLRVCVQDQCQWLYYDSSRNASARWCATSICGSRE